MNTAIGVIQSFVLLQWPKEKAQCIKNYEIILLPILLFFLKKL